MHHPGDGKHALGDLSYEVFKILLLAYRRDILGEPERKGILFPFLYKAPGDHYSAASLDDDNPFH